ncbi:MAG: ABC transporter permease [Planctomycetota bacterium]|nr:MAG: ABC transporter permease [Planctomycetota bacterium]
MSANAKSWLRFAIRRWPQILLFVAALWLTFTTDRFYTGSNLSSILTRAAIVGVLAVGQCCVLLAGGFDLSQGANVGLACAVAGTAMTKGYDSGTCFIAALSTGILVGIVNGIFVAKLGTNPFVTTLSGLMVVKGLTFIVLGGLTLNKLTMFAALDRKVEVAGVGLSGRAAVFILATTIIWIFLRQTLWGQHLRATGGNAEAARLAGVRTDRMKILSFALSGLCAGLASVLLLSFVKVSKTDTANGYELDSIASCVIGGVSLAGGDGSVLGAAAGCLMLKTIETIITLRGLDDQYRSLVTGALILTFAATDAWASRGRRK